MEIADADLIEVNSGLSVVPLKLPLSLTQPSIILRVHSSTLLQSLSYCDCAKPNWRYIHHTFTHTSGRAKIADSNAASVNAGTAEMNVDTIATKYRDRYLVLCATIFVCCEGISFIVL